MAHLENTVLRRKLAHDRPDDPARPTPGRAFRQAVTQAALRNLKLTVSAAKLAETPLAVEQIPPLLPDNALCFVLDGPGDRRGVVMLDSEGLASVVQALTTGFEGAEPPVRAPTATDAELCRRFLAEFVSGFSKRLIGHPAEPLVRGLVPGRALRMMRMVTNALTEGRYRGFTAKLNFADGAASGQLFLAVPWETPAPTGSLDGADDVTGWDQRLEARVLASHVDLDAVLGRLVLPLSKVAGLKVGDLVTLPYRALSELVLEAPDGTTAGLWRLGQAEGCRAIRLLAETAVPEDLDDDVQVDPATGEARTTAAPEDMAMTARVLPAAE
ncbi:MAG: hypothetical protein ACK5IB_04750 [Qingshengfaniella sp.]